MADELLRSGTIIDEGETDTSGSDTTPTEPIVPISQQVVSTVNEYYGTNDSTYTPTDSDTWTTTTPKDKTYVWVRVVTTYASGVTSYSTPVLDVSQNESSHKGDDLQPDPGQTPGQYIDGDTPDRTDEPDGTEKYFQPADIPVPTEDNYDKEVEEIMNYVAAQTEIFNKLTANGTNEGIFYWEGSGTSRQLYINASYIKTGTLVLGGSSDAPGVLQILDENDNWIGQWDKLGIRTDWFNFNSTNTTAIIGKSGGGQVEFSPTGTKFYGISNNIIGYIEQITVANTEITDKFSQITGNIQVRTEFVVNLSNTANISSDTSTDLSGTIYFLSTTLSSSFRLGASDLVSDGVYKTTARLYVNTTAYYTLDVTYEPNLNNKLTFKVTGASGSGMYGAPMGLKGQVSYVTTSSAPTFIFGSGNDVPITSIVYGNFVTGKNNSIVVENGTTFCNNCTIHGENNVITEAKRASDFYYLPYASYAEGGENTISTAHHAHAEGYKNTVAHNYAHAEGYTNTVCSMGGHVEGYNNVSGAVYYNWTIYGTHAEGKDTTADANAAHSQNLGTIANSEAQTALGKYNIKDSNGVYAVLVGNGTSNSARANALAVTWGGEVELALDTNAASGIDYELYQAITALGWESDVIV